MPSLSQCTTSIAPHASLTIAHTHVINQSMPPNQLLCLPPALQNAAPACTVGLGGCLACNARRTACTKCDTDNDFQQVGTRCIKVRPLNSTSLSPGFDAPGEAPQLNLPLPGLTCCPGAGQNHSAEDNGRMLNAQQDCALQQAWKLAWARPDCCAAWLDSRPSLPAVRCWQRQVHQHQERLPDGEWGGAECGWVVGVGVVCVCVCVADELVGWKTTAWRCIARVTWQACLLARR